MKRSMSRAAWVVAILLVGRGMMPAQGGFELVTGKPFDSAFVKDFYLEGNSIPTEKRNAALVRRPPALA